MSHPAPHLERHPVNAGARLLLANLAAGRGAFPYLRVEAGVRSYQEVAERALAVAAGLRALDVEPGERLLLVMGDREELVLAIWGAWLAGAVAVPVAPALAPAELGVVLADCAPKAILCDAGSVRAVRAAAANTQLPVYYAGDEQPHGTRPFSELCSATPLSEATNTCADDPALLLYTSGTTGRMKAAIHTHGNLVNAAAGLGPQVLHLSPEDVIFSAARMFFAYGLGNSVYLPAAAGASVVVRRGPVLPALVTETLEREDVRVFFGVPSLYRSLLADPRGRPRGTLRACVSAGERLAPDLREAATRWAGAPVLDGFGMTETLHHVTSNRLDEVVPGSAGRPLAGFEVKVTNEHGLAAAEGEAGELWVRGPTLMAGYWNQPALTARRLAGGYLRSGDVVRLEAGCLVHIGRTDDLVKVGGVLVAPAEVEEVLRRHPAVADAAVVPVVRRAGVATFTAFVVPRGEPPREAELVRHARQHLASFKVPRTFAFVEELPRTLTGKLRRFLLRETG